MSKIHQAMQRAEKEGAAIGMLRSRPPSTERAIGSNEPSFRPPIHDLVLPRNDDTTPSSPTDFSASAERTTAPDSRLVALSDGIYESLRDGLRSARDEARDSGKDLKSILFTGVGSGDGKSLTTANLSISISKSLGERVLLVDANLRAPSLHRFLGVDKGSGLSEVLQGKVAASQAVFRTDISSLYAVTAGDRVENPTQLLNTRSMSAFLSMVKEHFDWVLLDSPSLMPEPDADLVSSMVDGVIIVARKSQSSARLLRDGIQMLQGRNFLGIVLNDLDAGKVRLRTIKDSVSNLGLL